MLAAMIERALDWFLRRFQRERIAVIDNLGLLGTQTSCSWHDQMIDDLEVGFRRIPDSYN